MSPRLQTREKPAPAPSSTPVRTNLLQRKCACGGTLGPDGECAECRRNRLALQRGSGQRNTPSAVPSLVGEVLRSPGQPLDSDTRAFMEPRFGHDFGQVRVHADEKAAKSTQAVNSLAYTVGRDVVFGAGQYAPGTSEGRRLLAHELAHVVQQRRAPQSARSELSLGHPGAVSEQEAASASQAVMLGKRSPSISSIPDGQLQRQVSGEVKVFERRLEEEAKLPAKFPDKGIRVIGSDAQALVEILSDCTGILLTLDADNMLTALPGPVASERVSSTARTELSRYIEGTAGVIIDTNPAGEAVVVGAFGMKTPGYHQIDVGNIRTMAAASGKRTGLSACDAVMHEISEAVAGRKASLESGATGRRAYEPAHAEGVRIEEAIRKEFGLPLRSTTSHGDTVQLGKESDTSWVFLESTIFGRGKKSFTQLNVLRFTITSAKKRPDGTVVISGDQQVVASHVAEGVVKFSTQREALEIFNRHAADFGLKPITLPEGL